MVRDRVADDQTARGIDAASEVEAVKTVALVLLLIVETAEVICAPSVAANDVDAARTVALVLAFTFAITDEATDDEAAVIAFVIDVEAEVTSDCKASEPEVRPAPVNVLLPKLQISDAVGAEPAPIVDT